MNISHKELKRKGMFFVEEDGESVAKIDYSHPALGKINIYHTEVAESLRSQGVGRALVKAVVEHAREKGLNVSATCPFAKRVLEETPEYWQFVAEQ